MSAAVLSAFDTHVHSIEARLARATERLRLLSLVESEFGESKGDKRKRERDETERRIDDVAAAAVAELGAPLPSDEYEGDGHLRTLRKLLARIDARGYERSSQQLSFHNAFEIATARILYKRDWALKKPDIVKKNGWGESFSEVLISTPRRFGKTFSIAMFSACFALSMSTEVISPACQCPAPRADDRVLLLLYADRNFLACQTRLKVNTPARPPARPPAGQACEPFV